MMQPLLTIDRLHKSFRRNGETIVALDDVSLTIAPGETLALAGPSGSGKSTLARTIVRLIEPDRGQIAFDGQDLLALNGSALRGVRARLQMVFQDPLSAFNPRATVRGVIDDPLRIHGIAGKSQRPAMITALLDRVGIPREAQARAIHEISGGQRQRVAIARAIATSPALIVLDEAVSALDVSIRGEILALLRELQRESNVAYLFVSHDLGAVRAIADRIAVLDRGRIVEIGLTDHMLTNPQSPTARALISAAPRLKRIQSGKEPT